jgi:sugar phosphate isomerase/epimerase
MKVLFLATRWGFTDLPAEDFIIKIKEAGFDGVDGWLPEDADERREFIRLLHEYQMPIVCQSAGIKNGNIDEFCRAFEYHLNVCMECGPILINSHSGRDHFSVDEQLKFIDTAAEFSVKNNIRVVHETHRGRLGFSPYNAKQLFDLRPEMEVTADLSHWTCVTESYLERCPEIVDETIIRTAHLHARVGYTQGPQVPDPRVPEWQLATNIFMRWWARILAHKKQAGDAMFTVTPEFGPPPYMPIDPLTGKPVSDQFELNCFMKDLIRGIMKDLR